MVQARNLMGSKKDVLPLSQGGPSSLQPVKQQRWLQALMPSQPCWQPFVTEQRLPHPPLTTSKASSTHRIDSQSQRLSSNRPATQL